MEFVSSLEVYEKCLECFGMGCLVVCRDNVSLHDDFSKPLSSSIGIQAIVRGHNDFGEINHTKKNTAKLGMHHHETRQYLSRLLRFHHSFPFVAAAVVILQNFLNEPKPLTLAKYLGQDMPKIVNGILDCR